MREESLRLLLFMRKSRSFSTLIGKNNGSEIGIRVIVLGMLLWRKL